MSKEHKILNEGLLRKVDSMGGDLSIVRNARISYDSAWRAGEDKGSDERLINYLYKNGHNTPFESVVISFEVKAPIFVIRQWQRHRTQSYNEISARYKELPEEFYIPELEQITMQSDDNKQMKTDENNPFADVISIAIRKQNEKAFQVYKDLIAAQCPRELARSVLPVGTYSHMFTTANLMNWFKFLAERLHPHAQYEIRVYAEAILDELELIAPVAVNAFKKHTLKQG